MFIQQPLPQSPPVSFLLDNLQEDTSYRILLFAVNPKGRSEPTVIDDVRLKGLVKYAGQSHYQLFYHWVTDTVSHPQGSANNLEIELSPLLLAMAVSAAALFVFGCFVLVTLHRRHTDK